MQLYSVLLGLVTLNPVRAKFGKSCSSGMLPGEPLFTAPTNPRIRHRTYSAAMLFWDRIFSRDGL